MDERSRKADEALLQPGVFVGRCPNTGVIHRIKISTLGRIMIERKPYISPLDGWTQRYEIIEDEAEKHLWLILNIKSNPADWPK